MVVSWIIKHYVLFAALHTNYHLNLSKTCDIEYGCGEWEVYRSCAPGEIGKADGCIDMTEEYVSKH